MTIHHDKFAYGRLKSCDEQLSQDALSKIIQQMNATAEAEEEEVQPDPAETPATAPSDPAPEDTSAKDPADK